MSSSANNNNKQNEIAEATASKKLLLQLVSAAMIREPAVAKESPSFKTMKTCVDCIAKVDPEFILKMALYVRSDLGLRGSANTLAALAALNEKCRPFLKSYINHLCKLPTDWIQIAEFSRNFGDGQTLPAALRKALVYAFADFDEYELAKYNKESSSKRKEKKKRELAEKERKKKAAEAALRQANNDDDSSSDDWDTDSDDDTATNNKKKSNNKKKTNTSPATPKSSPKPFTIKRLINYLHISTPRYYVMSILGLRYPSTQAEFDKEGLGENDKRKFEPERAGKRMRLQVPKTWETQLTERGNNADTWQDLIDSGLPFMAMLRNLRNIIIAGVDEAHHNKIISRLENEDQIANSRQFPYRFFSAFESLKVDFKAIYWQEGEKEHFEHIKKQQNLFAKQCRAQKNGTLQAQVTNARNRAVVAALTTRGGGRGGAAARGRAAAAVGRGRGRAVAPAVVKIEPPLKPGEKPPPKKRDIPPTGLPSEALFDRYNAALNTAVKHATNNNIRPISGRTFVVVVVREDLMKNVGAGGGGVASTRTYLDLALLLGLMFRYGCEDPTILLCGPDLKCESETADDAWQPTLPRDGKLLDNLATLREETTKRMSSSYRNSDKRVFPYPTLQKVIDNAEPLDCLVVVDSCQDDYSVSNTNNNIDTPYANLYQMLNLLRDKVNPDLLYVSVDICGQPKAPSVEASTSSTSKKDPESRESDLNIHLTGFSDSILRFVAERGDSPLAYIEKIDEIKKLDVVEARKRDEEACAVELCQSMTVALQPKIRQLQSALDKRTELLSEENTNNSDVDIAEGQFRDASFLPRTVSAINSSKMPSSSSSIDRPLSYFSSSSKIKTTLRCFISSTFSDMLNERKALVQEVFPTVRRVLMERGIAIQLVEVDLRWGITEAMVHRDDALSTCLNEVARCSPLFVSLIGARRGYAPTSAYKAIKPNCSEVNEDDFSWINTSSNSISDNHNQKKKLSPTLASILAAQQQQQKQQSSSSTTSATTIQPSPDMSITRLEFLQALQSRKNFLAQEASGSTHDAATTPKLVVLLRDHSSVVNSGLPQSQLHWFKNENDVAASSIGNFALDISRAVANNEAVSASYKAPFSRVETTPQLHQSVPTCPVELEMSQFKQIATEKILEAVFKTSTIISSSNSLATSLAENDSNSNNKSNKNQNDNTKNEEETEVNNNNKLDSIVLAEQSLQRIKSHQIAAISVGREAQTLDLLKHLTKPKQSTTESNVTLVSASEGNGKSSFIHRVMWQMISGVEMMKSYTPASNNNNTKNKKTSSSASSSSASPNNIIVFHHDFSFGAGSVASCILRLVKTLIARLSLEETITASTNTVSECLAVLPQIYSLVGRRRHILYMFLTNTGSCIDQEGLLSSVGTLIPPTPSPSLNFIVEVSTTSSQQDRGSSGGGAVVDVEKFSGALRVRAATPRSIQLPDLDKSERCQVLHMHLQVLGKTLMESAAKGKFVSPLLRKSESGKASYLVAAVSTLALFSTHDTLMNDIRHLGSTTRAIQSDLLSKLETEFGFSKSLVEDVLSTIVLSQKVGGISERDLYYAVATPADQQNSSGGTNNNATSFSSSSSSFSFGNSSSSSNNNAPGSSAVQEVRRLLCVLERGLVWRNGVVDIALPALTTAITKRYLNRTPTVIERHNKLANYYLNSVPKQKQPQQEQQQQSDSDSQKQQLVPQLQFASPRSVVAMLYHALGASNEDLLERIITNISCLETAIQGGFLPLLFNLVDQLDFKFRVLAKKLTPFTVFLRKNQHILSEYPKLTLQSASHDQSVAVRKAAQVAIAKLTRMTNSKGALLGNKIISKLISYQQRKENNRLLRLKGGDDGTSSAAYSSSYATSTGLTSGTYSTNMSDDDDDDDNKSDIENGSFYFPENKQLDFEDRKKQLATNLCRALWQNVGEHGEIDCAQTFIPSAGNGLTCVASNDAGTVFTVGCKDGNAYSYNVIDGTSKKFSTPSLVTALFHMRNVQQQLLVGCDDGQIRIFSRDGSQTHQCIGHRRTIKQIACSPDNRIIFSAATDGTVRLWTFTGARGNNLRCIKTLRGHNAPVTCVAVHQQGSGYCVSGGWDGRICIWNQGNRDAPPTWVDLGGKSAAVRAVAFVPTMVVNVVAVTYDGQMHIFDVAAGHISASFPFAHNGIPISSISYQGDGKKLVTTDASGAAKIWRSGVNGTLFDTVTGHRLPATGVACHPTKDGSFATVSQDGSARFWEVRDVPGEPRIQALHAAAVTFITSGISHNSGSLIYSASRDQTVACRPSLVDGESEAAKVAFRVLADQAESPVVRIFSGHKKLLVTAHVDGSIKAWHNGPGLGGNDALFMWQSTKNLRFAPQVLCANEMDEVFFASDNYGFILGSLKDGKVWRSGSVKKNLLAATNERGMDNCSLVTAAHGGKHVVALGTNDGSIITKSYRRGDVSPASAIATLHNFREHHFASPVTAVSVYDDHFKDPSHSSNLSFVILAATRDGLVKFMTRGNNNIMSSAAGASSSDYRTTVYRLSTLLGIDESPLVEEAAFNPRPTIYATSVLVASHNRFAIGCSNGAILVGTFNIRANNNTNTSTPARTSAAQVDDLSLEGLFFASSSVTALSTVIPHSVGANQQQISAGRDNDQKSKIEKAASGLVSRKGAPGFDVCAGDSLGNLYRLQWNEIIGVLSREEKEEYFGVAAAGMMGAKSKSSELALLMAKEEQDSDEDNDDEMNNDDESGEDLYASMMNDHDDDDDDDYSSLGSTSDSDDDDDGTSSGSSSSSMLDDGDSSSSSPSSSALNNKKKNNALVLNAKKNKQSLQFRVSKEHPVWTQLKIRQIILTTDGVFKMERANNKHAINNNNNNNKNSKNKNFIAAEWADGRRFSIITQKPQRGWSAQQKKQLFADQKEAFQAACALHRVLPAAKEALRAHARMTIEIFGIQNMISNNRN